ncbi:MAG: HAMP domain-containing protein [Desulfobacterales bacterium]|nr:HAMP domain-containing protein [Desulfobacterales bacterium]
MFLKKINSIRHTLAFRLTLWYAGLFMLTSCVAFLFFYILITSVIRYRTDQDLLSEARTLSSILKVEGIDAVQRQVILEAQAAGEKKIFFRLLSFGGQQFSSSNMSYWRDIGIGKLAINQLIREKRPVFDSASLPDRKHKIRVLYTIIGRSIILQLGQSMENYTRFIELFRKIFVTTMASLFVFAAIVGWFMARRAVAGVEMVTQTARQISEGRLKERVPVKKHQDEIDQLAITFNQMLDRIQTLVTGIREMSDNIAHDLKSPITRIRGISEVSLTTGASEKEYESMAASTIEECDRLLDMINTMLVISKTEAGVNKLDTQEMDIAAVVRDACELFQSPAEDKDLRLICDAPGNFSISGDNRLIQRMIANLLDNAIKYTPVGESIEVAVQPQNTHAVVITVKDNGVGIGDEDISRIFERFYRCDPSRSQAGTGLGLSFARTVARVHGGDIAVTSIPNQGSTFTVTLPGIGF